MHRTFYPADRPPLTVQSGRGWHYTSLAALSSIASSQELWATSWRATNDRTEVHHGLEALSQAWNHYGQENSLADRTRQLLDEAGPFGSYADSFEHVNILCAARERDSPYQWNAYAAGPEGVAIGLNLGTELVTDVDDRPRRHNDAELFGMQWLKVIYTDRQKHMAAARFVAEMDTSIREGAPMEVSDFRALNLLTALNFKHPAFRHEKEARCVCLSDGVELQAMPANLQKTIVPWKGLPVRATPPTAERLPLPIVEVIASPWATEATVEDITRCLADAGMATVPVARSELPFR
ncbi:hypothetical protein GCM10009767_06720 [Kocuria aegyptia]|uniref:DUF2971 domain-containing protein n=1 Tax=Kocuria aegyptia TaxID=330943 RepID=A0ABN2K8C9_9MICC